MWNPFDFTGKKIIIAGATSGMGKAAAVRLSEQGAQVVLLGRNEEKLKETLELLSGSGHSFYVKDFSVSGGYTEIFNDIVKDGKKIDGLVYCAGIAKILPITLLKKETMEESMTVNLYSFAEMVGVFSKKKYHDKASVVGISSIAALYPQKCQGIYVATKTAMNGMVASMALELASKDIRINTVMPASTDTAMLRESFEGKTEEEIKDALKCQVLGMAQPEDIADIILFLLSDASRMITGREIYADGGYLDFFAE